MAALVQGYPQQSGTVTVLQTRPSSASGMLQSLAAQPVTQYVPGGSHRHSIHGLPSATTTHVVYRGGSATVQQPYALSNAPIFDPSASWQPPRAQRTSSSPAVPTIQHFDYLQPTAGRSRYSASVSMTNLPSTANYGLHSGAGSRDDSGLPAPGARRAAAAPRSSHTNNSQPSLAPAAPIRSTPERYRRTALRADSNSSSTTPSGSQLRPAPSAMTNRPNSFVGSVSGSAVDDSAFAQGQHEIKRVRRRSMPALDSPGFPLRPTPHDFQQQHQKLLQAVNLNRPESADLEDEAGKTGNHLAADKTSNDERPASSRSAGANAVAPSSSVSPSIFPHYLKVFLRFSVPFLLPPPLPSSKSRLHIFNVDCPIMRRSLPRIFLPFTTNTGLAFPHETSLPTLTPLLTPPCLLPRTRPLFPNRILHLSPMSHHRLYRLMPPTPTAPPNRRPFQHPRLWMRRRKLASP